MWVATPVAFVTEARSLFSTSERHPREVMQGVPVTVLAVIGRSYPCADSTWQPVSDRTNPPRGFAWSAFSSSQNHPAIEADGQFELGGHEYGGLLSCPFISSIYPR